MATTYFTEDHEWIRVDGDQGVIGISDYAQEQLGDVVFVELPDIGKSVQKGNEVAVVESVKAASEVYAPVGGEVTAVNDELADEPGKVNASAMGDGWFFKIRISNPDELDALMDSTRYKEYLEGLT